MKKFLIIPILFLSIIFIPNVKADSLTLSLSSKVINSKNLISDYEYLINFYNSNYSDNFNYYAIVRYSAGSGNQLGLYMFNSLNKTDCGGDTQLAVCPQNYIHYDMLIGEKNLEIDNTIQIERETTLFNFLSWTSEEDFSDFDLLLASNYSFKLSDFNLPYNYNEFILTGFYSDNIVITDNIPNVYDLLKYDSWSNYEQDHLVGYSTVNLDNYHYVILSLKDYSKTKAFSSNLQVKGMVGVTPVYNYGQTEKSKSDDRCNISFKDYTDYRLYILENDLKNNAIYIIKECESGSSFKYDSSVFDITYVTDDNVNDPVVSINGKDYHTIPFSQLSWSANQNESDNIVPGASCQVGDFNCQASSNTSSISDIINGITDTLQSVWNTLTTFMSLVIRFFNVLPVEIRAIAIATFSIMCVLGIIKFIKG